MAWIVEPASSIVDYLHAPGPNNWQKLQFSTKEPLASWVIECLQSSGALQAAFAESCGRESPDHNQA